MSSVTTLSQLSKAASLVNRAYHKNGPKSYKKGQGALIKVMHRFGGQVDRDQLIERLGYDRRTLKDVVRKAERNGYVTVEDKKKGYAVTLTDEGEKVAERRCAAHSKVADDILSALTPEEIEQLDTLTEKIIVSCKENGAHGKHKGRKKKCKKACHRR